jgi:hypothetical protein
MSDVRTLYSARRQRLDFDLVKTAISRQMRRTETKNVGIAHANKRPNSLGLRLLLGADCGQIATVADANSARMPLVSV